MDEDDWRRMYGFPEVCSSLYVSLETEDFGSMFAVFLRWICLMSGGAVFLCSLDESEHNLSPNFGIEVD